VTVAERIAQTMPAVYLEPKVEPMFHQDSYGYRPGRSALDAVATCRERRLTTEHCRDGQARGGPQGEHAIALPWREQWSTSKPTRAGRYGTVAASTDVVDPCPM
jgi:hypothetical protein